MKKLIGWFQQLSFLYRALLIIVIVVMLMGGAFLGGESIHPSAVHQTTQTGETQQTVTINYARAKVQSVGNGTATVRGLDGHIKNQILSISTTGFSPHRGDIVIVANSGATYYEVDPVRVSFILLLLVLFVVVLLLVARRRGVTSLAGLAVSIGVIFLVIVPLILAGVDAFFVCLGGAMLIAVLSMFIAHGFRRETVISVVCVLIILAIIALLSTIVVASMRLSGVVEDSDYVLSVSSHINMPGLVEGGIVIATLSALDDIVTTQVATVFELHRAKKETDVDLTNRAMKVGSEHITGLVNTLVLAYAGASLVSFLALYEQGTQSWYLLFNSELFATEVVRTITATIGLVLAVPLATAVAVFSRTHLLQWKYDK